MTVGGARRRDCYFFAARSGTYGDGILSRPIKFHDALETSDFMLKVLRNPTSQPGALCAIFTVFLHSRNTCPVSIVYDR